MHNIQLCSLAHRMKSSLMSIVLLASWLVVVEKMHNKKVNMQAHKPLDKIHHILYSLEEVVVTGSKLEAN